MKDYEQFQQIHLDVLKEIGNIGAGNAATALSSLINRRVQMTVPIVNIVTFDEMMMEVGGKDEVQAAVFVQATGDLSGSMFFMVPPEEADLFSQLMIGDQSKTVSNGDELATSAFLELGNILTGSYLRALSDFTSLEVVQSVPQVAIDMVGAMLTQGLLEISVSSDQAIMIETVLHDIEGMKREIRGHFFLLPNPETYTSIFESLGVNQL
ncbi:chemotaxis protein CheC [Alkalibacillus haloalkaliphilus]|uniref:chemotaxis protein CheC n=1 Tax=Alkalibacillus haloalkaliphilus TaxID=94136 RepID=UPI00293612CD|nr:chemotaxis protein CheC [Alkalibacillus haloalkaliphilus]MDV2580623.1 chemotaxis protein CheC [Alkalibacillus haloalkaliphilus]